MEKVLFDYIKEKVKQNPLQGVSYDEVKEKFKIEAADYVELCKSKSRLYGLKYTITTDTIFFS